LAQQWSFQFSSAFDLPKRIASMPDAIELIERPDLRQPREFRMVERWDAPGEIFSRIESAVAFARCYEDTPKPEKKQSGQNPKKNCHRKDCSTNS
jgi:hypothetical protein